MIVFAKPLGPRAQWAGLLLALTMLGMALAVSLALMRAHLLRVEEARLAAQASTIEANLQRQLQGVNAALAAVAHDLKGLGHRPDVPAALTRQLEALSEAMPGVRTMLVLNAAGRVLASTRADLIGQDLSEREYVQVAAQSLSPDELYLSSPFRTVFGLFTMVLVRVVHDEHGKTHRIVAASLAPDFFEVLLASVLYDDDVWTALAHENGVLTVIQPNRPGAVGVDLSQRSGLFARHMASGQDATVLRGHVTLMNEDGLMAQRTIRAESLHLRGAMVVAVARRPAVVLKGWTTLAMTVAVAWLLLSGAGVAGVWAYQRHRLQVARLREEKEQLRAQKEAEIRRLAFYDPLTQLPNRRMLMERLAQTQAASLRYRRCSAVFFIDLDHFKELNDQHGHEQGDRLLCEVARRLSACVREEDTVARLAGDEFVLLLSELDGQLGEATAKAEAVARKVLAALGEPYQLDGLVYDCSASVGVALFGVHPEPVDSLLIRADRAMYQAKAAGRNAYRLDLG